jgi:sodium/potassium/calcium exchanger 6
MHSPCTTRTTHTRRMPTPPARKSYRAARAFYLVIAIGLLLAACAAYARQDVDDLGYAEQSLLRRDVNTFTSEEERCRQVHKSKNQCHFIKKHCPDDEGGFGTYLDLFYCRLSHAKPVAFMILISWLGLLFSTIGIAASDFFCINLSTIASILGMSESMAGVTLLAFGNGSPDVFSTFAAMSTNSGSLAVGELMGAAVFITSVVAGSMALIKPFHVARKSFVRDVGFFIVAAGFSFSFLWDGRLQLWECIAMVIYYFFYVGFVVAWHWWIGRRRRERERQAAARGHYLPPGDEMDLEEEYRDDPESIDSATIRPNMSRGASREDFAALERGLTTPNEEEPNEDEEEAARDRWISELNSNMRLSRPQVRSRRNTIGPVRPSLVGALEFQAVLNSLQRSRNIQTIPLDTRYSDIPEFDLLDQTGDPALSDTSGRPPLPQLIIDTSAALDVENSSLAVPKSAPARGRAVSAGDASSRRQSPSIQLPETRLDEGEWNRTEHAGVVGMNLPRLDIPGPGRHSAPHTPSVEVSAPTPTFPILEVPEEDEEDGKQSDHLRVADAEATFRKQSDHFHARSRSNTGLSVMSGRSGYSGYSTESDSHSPRMVPQARHLPKIDIPRERRSRESTPSSSPFPVYWEPSSTTSTRPPSISMPPPMASPESLPVSQSAERENPSRPIRWWPYKILPAPGVLISTLFPTIYHWRDKSIWEKMIGVVAAPSVFLLTVTLPVVESDKDNEDEVLVQPTSYDSRRSQSAILTPDGSHNALKGSMTSKGGHSRDHSISVGVNGRETMASLVTTTEQHYRHNFGTNESAEYPMESQGLLSATPDNLSEVSVAAPNVSNKQDPNLWNRWLVLIQLYLAPLFCVLSFWIQSPSDLPPKWLVLPFLISMLTSTILLIPFLLATSATNRPNYFRALLSAAGFVVSIAWISTIASQVVGALKALAVICNMSHAIMGLTIFAVGNSLGDLVADITVAKLGYPVMALSACFGGPMLNILLGIGLSGSYILVTGAHHHQHKHPGSELRYKSYQIEVGRTLIVTGFTLLLTLVGLLIAVPLNKWVLSKRIGVALIALWVTTTIINVALELTGWGTEGSDN